MLCSKCMSAIKPGLSHICCKGSLLTNSQHFLAHNESIEPLVSSEISRKLRSETDKDSTITLLRPMGGHRIHLPCTCDQLSQKKMPKLDFSDLAQIKCTGGAMSNRQLKTVTKVIRNAGVPCPSMKNYYYERQLFCDDVLECVQLDLEWS